MPNPPTTSNHSLPLVPPLGEANASDFEDIWGSVLNEDGWSRLDEKLIARDTLANQSNYTAYQDALFRATDTGALYYGDGTSWNLADAEFADVAASKLSVSSAPSSATDVVRKSEIDSLDSRKLETTNYTPVSDIDGEISVSATSISGLDSAVDSNDTDISNLQSNKLDLSGGELTGSLSISPTGTGDVDSFLTLDYKDAGESGISVQKEGTVLWRIETGDAFGQDLQIIDEAGYGADVIEFQQSGDILVKEGNLKEQGDRVATRTWATDEFVDVTGDSMSGTLKMGTEMVEFADQNHYIRQASGGVSGIDGPEIAGWKGVALAGKENGEVLLRANSGGTVDLPSGGLDVSGDISDGTTTVWDSSTQSIESTLLSSDSVSIAGRSVSLGGSTNIAHGDLTSISQDQHHTKSHTHGEADISTVTNAGLSNSSLTVAGNSISLGGSSAIAHADLSSISSNDHHAKDHDHSEQGISSIGNQGLTNYQVTVAGNTVALGASKAIDHADLSAINPGDHHIAHEHPGDQAASSALNMSSNAINNVSTISGQYASHGFDGSSYNIDLLDSNTDARYRSTAGNTIIWFKEGGNVEVPNGQLSEQGNRVATRTYVDNSGSFDGSNPVPHPTYASLTDVPTTEEADIVHIADDGLYMEQSYETAVDDSGTPLQAHIDDNTNPHNVQVPVNSVNGMTGDVTIDTSNAPVDSVNGKTGAVTIDIPSVPVDSVNGQTGAVSIDTSSPVDSVNGQTGAVTINTMTSNGYEIFISDTAPSSASQGDIWIDNTEAFQ